MGNARSWGLWGHEELSVIKWCPYYRCDDCITSGDYVLYPYYWSLNAVLYICVPRELSLMERCPYYRCGDCRLGSYLCPYDKYGDLCSFVYLWDPCGTGRTVRDREVSLL